MLHFIAIPVSFCFVSVKFWRNVFISLKIKKDRAAGRRFVVSLDQRSSYPTLGSEDRNQRTGKGGKEGVRAEEVKLVTGTTEGTDNERKP